MGGLGGDNMSIIIICFLNGKPWQNLVDRCKRIHSEKKASSKLCEPAFTAFDRFTSEGPFAEVSVLKAASDEFANANETSSSSHTSSPSSSPISTEDKFDIESSQIATATGTTSTNTELEDGMKEKEDVPALNDKLPKIQVEDTESKAQEEKQNQLEIVKEIESIKTGIEEHVSSAVTNDETIVSNGD